MGGEAFVQATLSQRLDHLSTDRWEVAIIVEVSHILVIRNVTTDSGVARLADVDF